MVGKLLYNLITFHQTIVQDRS